MNRYLIVVAAVLLPAQALADWQYTRWGMTPAQVQQASRGAAKQNPNVVADTGTHRSERALLSARYRAGRFAFRALFFFDNASQKLVKVRLLLTGGGHCTDLRADLMNVYGAPLSQAAGIATRWRDTKRRNTVTHADWGGGGCQVEYEPLGSSGL